MFGKPQHESEGEVAGLEVCTVCVCVGGGISTHPPHIPNSNSVSPLSESLHLNDEAVNHLFST